MQTFEVGKIYQSRDNEHRRILVVGRTRCYITVQYIVDGNHAIDSTRRFKVSIASPDDCEMIFDSFNGYSYHAALEVIERPAVAEVSMAADDVAKSDAKLASIDESQPKLESGDPVHGLVGKCQVSTKDNPIRFQEGKCYLSQDRKLKVFCHKTWTSYCKKGHYAQFIELNSDDKCPFSSIEIKKDRFYGEKCRIFSDTGRWHTIYAFAVTPLLPSDRRIRHKNSRSYLIQGFENAFKDNYRNENPERLHPKNHRLTYEEVIDCVWLEKYKQLMGLPTYDDVYYAIRSEGYVINQTTLTVECKRFKPCDIKVGGR